MKPKFLNFAVDHMTFLVEPHFYNVTYALFRVIFGVEAKGIIYEKRRKWPGQAKEVSMTFAARIGEDGYGKGLGHTIMAVVQPSEPASERSHVREILKNRGGSAHWQHIALRTPDLLAFHAHAVARGVNFITPILHDEAEDLIQVFSGEWNMPGVSPTGIFFEFVQRSPSQALLKKVEARQSWFRDKTFLGLYGEKENEYRSGKVTPFIHAGLFERLEKALGGKSLWEITDADLAKTESVMKTYAERSRAPAASAGPNLA